MSILEALRDRFSSRERAAADARKSARDRYVDMVRAAADGTADPEEVERVLLEITPPLTVDDFAADKERLEARREQARSASQHTAAGAEVEEAGEALAQLENDHRAAIDAYLSQRSALVGQLSQAQRAADRARDARADILRSSPRRSAIEALKAQIAELRGPAVSAERINSLTMTANLEMQRALLDKSADPLAQPRAAEARQRAEAAQAEAARIEKMLVEIEKQEAKLRRELTELEAAAIAEAVRGELPIVPAAPSPEQRQGQLLHTTGAL